MSSTWIPPFESRDPTDRDIRLDHRAFRLENGHALGHELFALAVEKRPVHRFESLDDLVGRDSGLEGNVRHRLPRRLLIHRQTGKIHPVILA